MFVGFSALSSKHTVEEKVAIDHTVIIATEIVAALCTHLMPIYVFMHFTYANIPKHPETLLSRYNITHGTDEDAES